MLSKISKGIAKGAKIQQVSHQIALNSFSVERSVRCQKFRNTKQRRWLIEKINTWTRLLVSLSSFWICMEVTIFIFL